MKLAILNILALLTVSSSYAQYAYDKGYYINNNGERTDCLIRRLDGEYNPKKIEYKLDERSESVTLDIADVQEFGINGEVVFIRATVNIDRSSNDLDRVTTNRQPEWSRETIFLNILVSGDAKLYLYKANGITRFFFNTAEIEIQQLVYKAYYPYSNQIAYNKMYLEQLKGALICDKMPQNINVPYQAKPLESYFKKYNECKGVVSDAALKEKKAPVTASISFRPGVNFSSFTVSAYARSGQIFTGTFNSKVTFRVGAELEIYPSFNNRNKKWSVVLEPNFRYYNDEYTEAGKTYTVDYTSIELPIGLRRYFYLPGHKAIFLNVHLVYDFPSGKSGGQIPSNYITDYVFEYQITSGVATFAAGIGFAAKRLLGEFRYYSNRSLTQGSLTFDSALSNVAIVFGYRLLK